MFFDLLVQLAVLTLLIRLRSPWERSLSSASFFRLRISFDSVFSFPCRFNNWFKEFSVSFNGTEPVLFSSFVPFIVQSEYGQTLSGKCTFKKLPAGSSHFPLRYRCP